MSSLLPSSLTNKAVRVCPYLGLLSDSETPAIFPTEFNLCYRVTPPRNILENHQQGFCLSDAYQTCPVFIDIKSSSDANYLYQKANTQKSRGGFFYITLLAIFLGLALAFWMYQNVFFAEERSSLSFTPVPAYTPLPEQPFNFTPATDTASPTFFSPTLTSSPTLTNTLVYPTGTATMTPRPGLGTPIGQEPALVIHRVNSGESLTTIANLYKTSEASIRDVNFILPLPLWANWLLVVPYRVKDTTGLPSFEVYQVTFSDLSVAALAQKLNVNADILAQYNHIDVSGHFLNGDWVLVPRENP